MISCTKINGATVFFRDGLSPDTSLESTVLALGTFDGVHIAHKRLLECAVKLKNENNAALCGAFCFYQSPVSFLRGIDVPMICTFEQKLSLMLESGLDFVAAADFSDFCDMSADVFVNDVLRHRLGCFAAVCGFNHRFGRGGVGSSELLCSILGIDNVITLPEVKIDGETVSSTAIRDHLAMGEIAVANKMLGRAFSLTAPVLSGKKLGRTLGCPTANQCFPKHTVTLKNGIYATLCHTEDNKTYIGASNVGVRPSIGGDIDDHSLNCETLIYDFSREIYGESLTVEFYEYLRGEQKFSSLDELSRTIQNDLANAVDHFNTKDQF